jgi:hypothetical protein
MKETYINRPIGNRKKKPIIANSGNAGATFFKKEAREARPLEGAPPSMTLGVMFPYYKLAH